MKKLFFTAILLVGFSGVSMAGNPEEKKEVLRADACTNWAVEQVNADEVEFGCYTATEYTQAVNDYITKCKSH